jgi:hypothetical protein
MGSTDRNTHDDDDEEEEEFLSFFSFFLRGHGIAWPGPILLRADDSFTDFSDK